MKDEFKRTSNKEFRVGGYNCRCCGPSRKEKDFYRRLTRHRLKQEDKNGIINKKH